MKKTTKLLALMLASGMLMSACAANGATDSTTDSPYTPSPAEVDANWFDNMTFEAEDKELGESYLDIRENPATDVSQETIMTFSLKVDTASYTNVQRYLQNGMLPPKDAVRTEELINYFSYDAPVRNTTNSPFAVQTEIGPSPFDSDKYMVFTRIKTEEIDKSNLPPSNLVFLIDTSGSMDSYDKLPLLKQAFSLLVETLGENDRVSIVTYAGSSEIVLDSANGAEKERILTAINNLTASGSTAGADGINTAYQLAQKNLKANGNNRVILATDGDFNVGISNTDDLANFVSEKRDSGIYLSILGFGTGNIRDDIMETLSKNGNGNYAYINNTAAAQKVLIEEIGSNLFTVADDVKAQIEFNPANVANYCLIGYENRRMHNEDFRDDTKDAGEIGAGTDVVIMYEIELAGSFEPSKQSVYSAELFEVRIRYKNPGESKGQELRYSVKSDQLTSQNSSDFGFACSVAAFGHLLRDSDYTGSVTIDSVRHLAVANVGDDKGGYRHAFIDMLNRYEELAQADS